MCEVDQENIDAWVRRRQPVCCVFFGPSLFWLQDFHDKASGFLFQLIFPPKSTVGFVSKSVLV
jgi:hypothetical protein